MHFPCGVVVYDTPKHGGIPVEIKLIENPIVVVIVGGDGAEAGLGQLGVGDGSFGDNEASTTDVESDRLTVGSPLGGDDAIDAVELCGEAGGRHTTDQPPPTLHLFLSLGDTIHAWQRCVAGSHKHWELLATCCALARGQGPPTRKYQPPWLLLASERARSQNSSAEIIIISSQEMGKSQEFGGAAWVYRWSTSRKFSCLESAVWESVVRGGGVRCGTSGNGGPISALQNINTVSSGVTGAFGAREPS